MGQEKEKRQNGVQRYSIATNRTSSLRVIPFDQLMRKEHVVWIIDMSVGGVGIALNEPIELGLVCFEEQVGGHKFGVVRWCKESGEGYRAGINFVTLPKEEETYLLEQVRTSCTSHVLHDPERIITNLLATIKREIIS